jgi:transmembrane sensor
MSRKLRREASRWLVRLQSEDASPADRAAFEVWYRADPRHAQAFDALADTIDRLRQLRGWIPEEAEPKPAAIVLSRRGVFATAAGGLLAACFVVFAWVLAAPSWNGESASFETALGVQRQVDLSDGSKIELNTNTRLDVRMSAERRHVKLAHGEALFRVAHEPKRPFEVEAGGQVLRAVGTVFSVRVDEHASVLLVTEGAVLVTPKGGGRRQLIKAAERFDLVKGTLATLLSANEVDRALSWRRGMLDFDGVALIVVVAEVERYTGAHFEFADPGLEAVSMAAYFRAADVEGFISLLETSYPLLRVRATDTGYLIERRPGGTR